MQTILERDQTVQTATSSVHISLEFAAYLALASLALLLRFAELDSVPLAPIEAHNALAAWRSVFPNAVGTSLISTSPILFTLQSLAFNLFGGSELAARALTAVAGAVVVTLPALFRPLLGRERAFCFSLLLLLSPNLLAASRFSSPVVWSLLFAGIGLWGAWRFSASQRAGDGILAVVMAAALICLSEPGGLLLALMIGAASAWAWRTREDEHYPTDTTDQPSPLLHKEGEKTLPWNTALMAAGLVVFIIATRLMLYPAGLSAVGEAVGGALRGLGGRSDDLPFAYPLLISLFYEPIYWLFSAAALWITWRRGEWSLAERFFTAWLALALVAGLIFGAAGAAHSLWYLIPLAGLASSVIVRATRIDLSDEVFSVPAYARWLTALAAVALLAILTISAQDVGRSLLSSAEGNFGAVGIRPTSGVLVVLAALLLIVGFFMIASAWTNQTALRGLCLGILMFFGVTGLGSGWRVAVANADQPGEFWHMTATHANAPLLRETLIELARREAGGFTYYLPVVVQAPDDGVLAWLLRDFRQARFTNTPADAAAQPIALLTFAEGSPPPDLGGAYVGQDFLLQRAWDWRSQRLVDLPAWWMNGRTRAPFSTSTRYALWLRQDIYMGVEFETDVQG